MEQIIAEFYASPVDTWQAGKQTFVTVAPEYRAGSLAPLNQAM